MLNEWRSELGRLLLVGLTYLIVTGGPPATLAQPRNSPSGRIDPAEIRRQATQRAELRALLADPDADVRLMTMREAINNGDDTQRQAAIEAGLASNETAMLEQAVRGIMKTTQTIILELVDAEGKPTTTDNQGAGDQGTGSIQLTIAKFDAVTGRVEGTPSCYTHKPFQGQFQGAVFAFQQEYCSASLVWSPDTADFRGRVMLVSPGRPGNVVMTGVWRPR